MKNKKIIITVLVCPILIIFLILGINFYHHSDKLTVTEKKCIDENHLADKIINVNIINDADVFGLNGKGVFYDFIKDFENKYSLNVNAVTFNYGNLANGVSLGIKTSLDNNDIVFYKDHFVLVGKNNVIVDKLSNLNSKKIGVLASNLAYVSSYLNGINIGFNTYENNDDLYTSLEENDYIIVPLHLNLEKIIKGNYHINFHLSDINIYYTMSIVDDTLSGVLKKYYNVWQNSYQDSYNENLFNLLTDAMQISSTEIDAMRSITYEYGYTPNLPYEVYANGNEGGIAIEYMNDFALFADVEISYNKFRTFNKLAKVVAKENLDIYYNYYNINNDFHKTEKGSIVNYVVVANKENDIVINSINSLIGKTVYVHKNSLLSSYLNTINGITIKTYSDIKDLLRLNKKDVLIFLDKNIYDYYGVKGLNNYSIRYNGSINHVYNFSVKNDNAFYRYLNVYMSIMDANTMTNRGIYNHMKIAKSGLILKALAKYFLYILLGSFILIYIIIKKSKKITIAKKIKKEDKIRFVDQLTLLKNRNYLNENIENWNNNTIYPQTIMIIDLNNIKGINDVDGYENGDKQIRAAASILIKTQLDNSDVIRTDGNEFVIYLVGYSQKQITNYIHKLNKEFKKLPYNYGAKFGYSMITDDIKTIEDALNEATKALKEQKLLNEEKNKKVS